MKYITIAIASMILSGCAGPADPMAALILGGVAAASIGAASQAHTENENTKQMETIMNARKW